MKTVKTLFTFTVCLAALILSMNGAMRFYDINERKTMLETLRANNHNLNLKVIELRKINKFNCLIEVTPVMEAEMDLLIAQARRISEMLEKKILED